MSEQSGKVKKKKGRKISDLRLGYMLNEVMRGVHREALSYDEGAPYLTAKKPTLMRDIRLDRPFKRYPDSRAQRWGISPQLKPKLVDKTIFEEQEWEIVRDEDVGKQGFVITAYHAGCLWVLLVDLSDSKDWKITVRRAEASLMDTTKEDALIALEARRVAQYSRLDGVMDYIMPTVLNTLWIFICHEERARIQAAFERRAAPTITSYQAWIGQLNDQKIQDFAMHAEEHGTLNHLMMAKLMSDYGIKAQDVALDGFTITFRWLTQDGKVLSARVMDGAWEVSWLPQDEVLTTSEAIEELYARVDADNQICAAFGSA
jgi:hypothetical protein